ncbi:TetR/AcrR family transcriptional regulator [Acidovorax sp.]|uniref:TetR/AcrR family transcriptional regulator n=1 Tax=Acidovorax sp. TaxID=1872122 RepID=UPI00391FA542
MSTELEESPPLRRRGRPPKVLPQGTDLRASLVDAAAMEIREVGWFATSTNRIAARAGLSSGVFYNYFSDKVEVLLAVYERWVSQEWAMVREVFGEPGLGARERIDRLVPLLIEHHSEWSRLRHALAVLARDDERVHKARLQSRINQIDEVVRLIGRRSSAKLRTAVAIRLMMFEAVADAIAAGDADAMILDRRTLSEELASSLIVLLMRPPPGRG